MAVKPIFDDPAKYQIGSRETKQGEKEPQRKSEGLETGRALRRVKLHRSGRTWYEKGELPRR